MHANVALIVPIRAHRYKYTCVQIGADTYKYAQTCSNLHANTYTYNYNYICTNKYCVHIRKDLVILDPTLQLLLHSIGTPHRAILNPCYITLVLLVPCY